MESPSGKAAHDEIWNLIKGAHTAVLVTVGPEGALQSRPMGCVQKQFEGDLWFLTFRRSSKIAEISTDDRVLVSYANPARYDYVSVSGRAHVLDDRPKIRELWFEGLRAWFPDGPDSPDLALIEVEAEEASYWTNASSLATYAWAYIRARVAGKGLSSDEIADTKKLRM